MNERKIRILCYGDSNTWGYIAGSGGRFSENERWTGILQTMLGEKYTVIEEGHNGRTTVWDDPIENKLSGLTYFLPCVESHAPLDLIIISLGVNDLKPRFNVNAATIARGLERYFEVLKIASLHESTPKVLVISPTHMHPAYKKNHDFRESFGEDAVERSEQFAAEYKALAEKYNAGFLDAALYAQADPIDGLHYTKESHRKIAEILADKVHAMFE